MKEYGSAALITALGSGANMNVLSASLLALLMLLPFALLLLLMRLKLLRELSGLAERWLSWEQPGGPVAVGLPGSSAGSA
jgi:hypothetical protein